MRTHCIACGYELREMNGLVYCPMCRLKRFRQPVEIDPETGEWEGMTHGKSGEDL
jgi:uncharacterized Zn finger protein (UPF0148 family)